MMKAVLRKRPRRRFGARERRRRKEKGATQPSSEVKVKPETTASHVSTGASNDAAPEDIANGGLKIPGQKVKVEGQKDAGSNSMASTASSARGAPVTSPGSNDTPRQHSSGATKGRLISVKIEHKTDG